MIRLGYVNVINDGAAGRDNTVAVDAAVAAPLPLSPLLPSSFELREISPFPSSSRLVSSHFVSLHLTSRLVSSRPTRSRLDIYVR